MSEQNRESRFKDLKTEYLIKTFARTTKKQFENYVVNAIWNRLGRFDLQPVTQQYVKLRNGKYALLDLYFPQLNVGIECDESHHPDHADEDEERAKSVSDVLNAIDETTDFELLRIKAYMAIDEIDSQIDECVVKIRSRINDSLITWRIINKPAEEVLKNGKISVEDRLEFRTIQEACICFGRANMPIQRSYFNIGNDYQIWCPKLAINDEGQLKPGSAAGWINTLSEDMEYIYESHPDMKKIKDMHHTQTNPRIVFAKSRSVLGIDAYRFLGVYQYQGNREKNDLVARVYKRIAKEMDINSFIKDRR